MIVSIRPSKSTEQTGVYEEKEKRDGEDYLA